MLGSFLMILAFISVAVMDCVVAISSYERKGSLGRSLCVTSVSAMTATICYLLSVITSDYFIYSVLSSIYFSCIDITLLALYVFVWHFTNSKDNAHTLNGFKPLAAFLVFDIIVMLINPFYEIAIHYLPQGEFMSRYLYVMYPLYRLHLTYTYLLVGLILYKLIRRWISVPSIYTVQYRYAVLIILLIIVLNSVYTYMPQLETLGRVDYSLFGYSACAFLMYWVCYIYSGSGLIKHFQSWIFENLDQGLILFDNSDKLILKNDKAVSIMPEGLLTDELTLNRFVSRCGLDRLVEQNCESCSTICYLGGEPYRCDCSVQMDRKHSVLGRLFVFSSTSPESDMLTGFRYWDSIMAEAPVLFSSEDAPIAVATCDINSLSEINRTLGSEVGDLVIRALSNAMRDAFPEGTVFARSNEAYLDAVCKNTDAKTAAGYMEQVKNTMSLLSDLTGSPIVIQSTVSVENDPERLAETALSNIQSIHNKKMIDKSSAHSEVLYSLVQALEQTDNDTGDHVLRTQEMSEKLGRRLGLSDLELSNLALLAILHDIGKIGIPLEILNKPGKLTAVEWEVLKTHVHKGYHIANSSQELKSIADLILYHHERWDGKGYPDGLSGETIPLVSRIISVVDAYDAMTNDRAYRKALSKEAAKTELRWCAGTQFDPVVVAELLRMLEEEEGEELPSEQNAEEIKSEAPEEQGDTVSKVVWSSGNTVHSEMLHIYPMQFSRYVLDKELRIVEIDDRFTELTGYSRDEVIEKSLTQFDLIFENDREAYAEQVNKLLSKDGCAYLEHRLRRKDGSSCFVYCFGRQFYDSAVRAERSEIIVTDVANSYAVKTVVSSEHDKASGALRRWEETYTSDSLTGLLLHEPFRNEVELRLLSGENAMMVVVDIDKFGEFNDLFGHRAGDEAIILVAQALTDSIRDDDLACRFFGDKFGAVLFFDKNESPDVMMSRARQICDRINMMRSADDVQSITVSMGCAFTGDSIKTYRELHDAANQAMYRAKKSGGAQLATGTE